MSSRDTVKLSFLGGASSIGASCAFLEVGQTRLVIDCGVRFELNNQLPDLSQLGGGRLDAIVLTHAHSDHSGGLPVLCEAHPATPVYTTPPTRDLASILFQDALKLMNGPERDAEIPLYTSAQVDRLLANIVPLGFGQRQTVNDVAITLLPASHILGAAMLHLQTPVGNILFTGDFSVSSQLTVPSLQRPSLHVDLLVTESTYGSRLHEDRRAAEERLVAQIRTVVERQGRVLIPAFAIGRAQEVLLILKRALRNGKLPRIPVFVDGMVRRVCAVYRQHESYVTRSLARDIRRDEHPFYANGITPVNSVAERDKALAQRPAVVVASSGMLSGGASVVYASSFAGHTDDAIFITGYQDEESPGRALLRLAAGEGERQLKLGEQVIDVRCQVDTYGLSAHADRMQIVGLVEAMRPRTVVLVHGDDEARQNLARGLSCNDVIVAENGQILERAYARRQSAQRGVGAWVDSMEMDFDVVRNALGPPSPSPVRAAQIAEAWFGERVKADVVDQFVSRLVHMGLVRRDDHRRNMLWILAPGESAVLEQEAQLEARLKQENPKGRLLELCMRLKTDPPVSDFSVTGAFHVAQMHLVVEGVTIDSGVCRAASKRTAEQLAAEAVLKRFEKELQNQEECVGVQHTQFETFRRDNPKGALLEWCAKRRIGSPLFDEQPDPAGFRVRATLQTERGRLASKWYCAPSLRMAQHAASAALLQLAKSATTKEPQRKESDVSQPRSPKSAQDARITLNEMKQQGLIADFGYTLGQMEGPSHQPVFTLTCWATTQQGRKIESPDVQASSKRAAQRVAAEQLLGVLKSNITA